MAALLQRLAARQDVMLVMGEPKPGLDLARAHARRWADCDPVRNTLVAVERAWLPIDVDGYAVPAPFGRAEHLADAAAAIRDDALGEEFAGVACVVAATSSTGLAGEETAKLRLFFLLDRAHPIADLHRWGRGAQIAGLPVDPAVLQAGQPIYTARPLFRGRLKDPVPPALCAFVLPGDGDRVALDVHRYDAPAAETSAGRAGPAALRRRLAAVLADTLGGPASFFQPLTQALGMAARTDEDEDEIIGWTLWLIGERADPARHRQYGPQWCHQTLQQFRQRDGQATAGIAALRAQIFREDGRA